MAIRAVVFDIGGVLELTSDTGWRHRWELRHGAFDAKLRPIWKAGSLGLITETEVHSRIGSSLGLDPAEVDDFMHDVWTDYLGTLNQELFDFFASLRPRVHTGIISNSFVGATEREQQRYGFADICDCIIYSHETGLEKPDPRIFQLWCERMRVRPDEVVFLDDRAEHVAAATALGMHAILYQDNRHAIETITRYIEESVHVQ